MFEFPRNWLELSFCVLLIVGVRIALAAPSAAISYVIIFLAGIFSGRLIYEKRSKIQLPYFLIIISFVIGYLIGVYYGSRRVIIALFVVGAVLGYKRSEEHTSE